MESPYKRGLASYDLGAFPEAVALFTESLSSPVDPGALPRIHYARAKTYEKLGRYRDALTDVKEMLRAEGALAGYRGYVLAGRLWAQVGDFDKAEKALEVAREKADGVKEQITALENISRTAVFIEQARSKAEACPIQSLPAELLVHILSFAITAHDTPLPPPTSEPSPTRIHPLVASSHVCRQWRATLLQASSLWGRLRIDGKQGGAKAMAKVEWWSARSLGRRPGEREGGRGAGITSLTITSFEQLADLTLRFILAALEREDDEEQHPSAGLTSFACSYTEIGGANHQQQLNVLMTHLTQHAATTLTSLTLHTITHLHVHFSLTRFANTFTKLSTLSLRSAPSQTNTLDMHLLSRHLPPYEGEDDWPPTALRSLTLVGPFWRLHFQDGTLGSPELTREDCPLLEELELGPTSPPMAWDLLSAPRLQRLILSNSTDAAQHPDPDLSQSAHSLTDLQVANSPRLVTRLLQHPALVAGVAFPHLQRVNLRGANISGPLLSRLLSSSQTLTSLNLSYSTSNDPFNLPSLPSLLLLDLSHASWITPEWRVESLKVSAPKLQRLNLSHTAIRGRGIVDFASSRKASSAEESDDPGLLELNLVGCIRLEDAVVKQLKEVMRDGGLRFKMGVVAEAKEERRRWKGVGEW